MKTLEDLKLYLENKSKDEWKNDDIDKIIKNSFEIIELYDLTDEEQKYASPIKLLLEEQSHQKTIINTTKAKEILLKRK